MTVEHMPGDAYVVSEGDGQHLEFLNHLATIKVEAGDGGSMSVVEFLAPRGFGPPEHRHQVDDELFVVLEGEIRFRCGDVEADGAAGAVAYLPRGGAHTFQVLSDTARFVVVNASSMATPRFDAMVSALGTPTDQAALPEPAYIDPSRVAAVCAAHGIDVVGPPPPQLPEMT